MRNNFLDSLGWSLVAFAILVFGFVIYVLIAKHYDDKNCKIYSELKTKNGVMLVGKAVIPTTYQGRDCLVWENKE